MAILLNHVNVLHASRVSGSGRRDGRVTPQRKYDARGNAQLPNNGPLPLGGEPHPYTEDLSSRSKQRACPSVVTSAARGPISN